MKAINQALIILKEGGLVGLPTETVYGLAADASNEEAVRKIFAAKNRPLLHPLIVHIGKVSQLPEWAEEVSPDALRLAKKFWPGPLTMVFKKASSVSPLVTGSQESIAIRIPNHPVALKLLKKFKGGLAAPSANKFGKVSPTTAAAVREELGDEVSLVLEGGKCDVGVESTIVDMTSDTPTILRPGMITKEQIEKVLKKQISQIQKNSPRVSGSCESHYAPETPVYVLAKEKLIHAIKTTQEEITVLALTLERIPVPNVYWYTFSSNPQRYAHDLYFVLRELDKRKFAKILIEEVPSAEEWDAIRDRLKRASQ